MGTDEQFKEVLKRCLSIYLVKLDNYGPSWSIFRPETITDQILIKILRIRSLESGVQQQVDESIQDDYIAIINYGIIAILLLQKDCTEISVEEAKRCYSVVQQGCADLMYSKNNDYGEAWRKMRVQSYTDLMYAKLNRIKQMEDSNAPSTEIISNFQDIINYAVFGVIRTS